MNRSLFAIALVVSLAGPCCCYAGTDRGKCEFLRPNKLIKLRDSIRPMHLEVLRINAEPSVILIADDWDDERKQVKTTAINIASGERRVHIIPFDQRGADRWPPSGYTEFVSGQPDADAHPLLASGTLRFEYLGRKIKVPFLGARETKWTVDHEEIFTGTRRMMYGTRPLLEQDFVNMRDVGDRIFRNVQIEPDGDRIVCKCEDSATWIAIYSKSALERDQASGKKK